jgi:hypothetical protein
MSNPSCRYRGPIDTFEAKDWESNEYQEKHISQYMGGYVTEQGVDNINMLWCIHYFMIIIIKAFMGKDH